MYLLGQRRSWPWQNFYAFQLESVGVGKALSTPYTSFDDSIKDMNFPGLLLLCPLACWERTRDTALSLDSLFVSKVYMRIRVILTHEFACTISLFNLSPYLLPCFSMCVHLWLMTRCLRSHIMVSSVYNISSKSAFNTRYSTLDGIRSLSTSWNIALITTTNRTATVGILVDFHFPVISVMMCALPWRLQIPASDKLSLCMSSVSLVSEDTQGYVKRFAPYFGKRLYQSNSKTIVSFLVCSA